MKIFPQLAADLPSLADGGKTVTIKLRSGVKFNDGTPMNAEAVRFSLERHLTWRSPTTTSTRARRDSTGSYSASSPTIVVTTERLLYTRGSQFAGNLGQQLFQAARSIPSASMRERSGPILLIVMWTTGLCSSFACLSPRRRLQRLKASSSFT
ncbi:MAG: hypothetical protein HY712_01055 [candidate division NC10 bacterium]|nr:hypothetical protein [candidate division NC10 bacterium]